MGETGTAIKQYRGQTTDAERQRILTMHIKGVGRDDIAKVVGRNPSSVQHIITSYQPLLALMKDYNPEQYKTVRKNLLTSAEFKLLKSCMDDSAIERANLRDRAYSFTQAFNARRLEDGQSTSNQAVSVTFTSVPTATDTGQHDHNILIDPTNTDPETE